MVLIGMRKVTGCFKKPMPEQSDLLMLALQNEPWQACRFLSCSVLPVRVACNCRCSFCFSRSSVSALKHERTDWRSLDVEAYYRWTRERGASRLVITGGGEPLLRPEDVVY